MRHHFPKPFRRYAGVIIDLAFDHLLARSWACFSNVPLEEFDRQVRALLDSHSDLLPARLVRFMAYADTRGLFAAYRSEAEMLFSLAGVGTRFRRSNPLHRVGEVWPTLKPALEEGFEQFYPQLQSEVAEWRKRRSMMTGS